MAKSYLTSCLIALMALPVCATIAPAADSGNAEFSSQWDSAISSLLLAAGMYGVDARTGQGANLSLSQSENLFKGIPFEQGTLDGQNITLSYSGSSGRLGFSAGYIYTSLQDNQQPEALYLDLSPQEHNPLHNDKPWFITLDMSKSFQVNDSFSVGFGSKAMLMKNPFDTQDGRVLSMLLNLPMSYKNYFTITPELQWSKTLPELNGQGNSHNASSDNPTEAEDVFYGGMSISFSY